MSENVIRDALDDADHPVWQDRQTILGQLRAAKDAGDELARLLQLAYDEARPDDPEIPCRMDGRGGMRCWCREVRSTIKAWNLAGDGQIQRRIDDE